MNARKATAAVGLLLGLFIAVTANAQSVSLTPQQQQMLNQLPPAQRAQALEAIRDAGGQSAALEPLRETDTQDELAADLSPRTATVQRADPRVGAPKPFGYDLFESNEAGFDPPMTGPVPPDYVLGPGDTLRVQFFGNVNAIYEYDVTRDGILNLPELGPVNVGRCQSPGLVRRQFAGDDQQCAVPQRRYQQRGFIA
jgi:hypothetical protein